MFDYNFHWRAAFKALPDMLNGAIVTFETAALSMILGVTIALFLVFMRQGKNRLFRGFAATWISIARNTPSLFQVYILYFGLGSFGLHVSSWAALLAGIVALLIPQVLKSLVDGLNWEEFDRPWYSPTRFDRELLGISFYHNIAFLQKGNNQEGSNLMSQNRCPWPRPA